MTREERIKGDLRCAFALFAAEFIAGLALILILILTKTLVGAIAAAVLFDVLLLVGSFTLLLILYLVAALGEPRDRS